MVSTANTPVAKTEGSGLGTYLKALASRHAFSQTWQYHRSRVSPLLFSWLDIAFVDPASARPIVSFVEGPGDWGRWDSVWRVRRC